MCHLSKYQTFAKEFKIEAVRLLEQSDKTAAELALSQGARRNQLYKWQAQLRGKARQLFAVRAGCLPTRSPRLCGCARELARVTEERDILKKAAAHFAKESR
jgi:transposase